MIGGFMDKLVFGHLTVIRELPFRITPCGTRVRRVEVQCTCGSIFSADLSVIKYKNRINGNVRCRSCAMSEINKKVKYKHGLLKHPLYHVWAVMRERCNNPNSKDYKNYGGRGITCCYEWNNFKSFYNWAINDYKKGLQLDRINNNKGYSPNNCRWVTPKENALNRRNNIYINGVLGKVWFERQPKDPSVSYILFYNRVFRLGWNLNKALLTPKRFGGLND